VQTNCFAYSYSCSYSSYYDTGAYPYDPATNSNDPSADASDPFANSGNSDPSAFTHRVKRLDNRDLDHRLLGLLQAELFVERQGQRRQPDTLV